MEITLTVNYGPINAEISGEDREKLQKELLEFVNFLGEEKDNLSTLSTPKGNFESEDEGTQAPLSGWEDTDSDPNPSSSSTSQDNTRTETEFASLSTKTGINEETLDKLFELPDDDEGPPSLNMYHFDKGVLRLGNARNQRQAQASSLLMLVWEECLDKKKIQYLTKPVS
jgi:hypothetical protein